MHQSVERSGMVVSVMLCCSCNRNAPSHLLQLDASVTITLNFFDLFYRHEKCRHDGWMCEYSSHLFAVACLMPRSRPVHCAMAPCANPRCDQPGTSGCASCRLIGYCSRTFQTAHWALHKEECQGHLRKLGMAHFDKARGFDRDHNWSQVLRYSDLAATKLKQLKDRPLDDIADALSYKYTALGFMGKHREQLECAKEWYCLWNTKPTDMGAIQAAFALIDSCMHNKEYADARLYASTLFGILPHKHDNKIPDDKRQPYIAQGAYFLATATLQLARDGGIPPEEKQKAGQEAIALARRALEIHTQLVGTDHATVASAMGVLADALDHFNDCDDDEVLCLFEQAKAIHARVYGSSSVNVAVGEEKLGTAYHRRANRAHAANDLDRFVANLELAVPRFREAARIYRAIGRVDDADRVAQEAVKIEQNLRHTVITRAVALAVGGTVTTTKS